uniref:Integrase catalytic domain-containing protein n=1 Tax=Cacopsylla melanoneura TaxID=428564 RepID=A0A8D9B6W8_9HEMI
MRVYGTKVSLLDKANKVWDLHLSVTPTIVGEDKSEYFDMKMINNLASTYTLADECFTSGIEQNYDILIGNDYYLQFVIGDRVQIQDNLFLLNTVFGHVFSGQLFVPRDSGDNHMTNFASISLFLKADTPLLGPQNLNFFWDLETLGIKENPCESEDDLALRNFERDLKCVNNRYYVSFPWRDVSKCDVQTNYGLALGRLGSLLKRHKDDGLLDICDKTFQEQVNLGVIERVESDSQKVGNYLPFHAIRKETSETTKVRLVMDASAKQVRSKPSLNELLYRGPVLLENLCSLLLRFRLHEISFVADIEKAFLNIGLNEEDRDFTKILWVKDKTLPPDSDNLITYRHCRIPFGVISSPFLLAGTIRSHLDKYGEDNVLVKLKSDLYVDNLVSGVSTEEELTAFITKSREIFGAASLNLRSWATNSNSDSFEQLGAELKSQNSVQCVLGVDWDTKCDTLSVKFTFEGVLDKVTKRTLLGIYGSFYDVMGLWAPSTVKLKFLLQSSWTENKDWDSEIDGVESLVDIVHDLKNIPAYKIPRLVSNNAPGTRYELHAYSDACTKTYAATIYLRCIGEQDICTNLMFSKIKIAPRKQTLTLPRLELLGVLIAFRSLKFVRSALNLNIDKFYLWCDNQCVLCWLNTTKVLPVFIKNRVNEIKASPFPIEYRYVRSQDNPSDVCCRQGKSGKELRDCSLWWKGPEWLEKTQGEWPSSEFPSVTKTQEVVDTETSVDLFMAFRKFIARRGGCTTLLSDNAQQFKLLKKAVDSIYSFNDFQSYLNQKKIVFKFTSPLTPWAGGTFERLISVTKQCIRKALGKGLISYSQLETILTEVQYMVNDRPLGYVSNEDLIITPNHFLCLKRDSLLPDIASSCESVPGSVTFKNLINLWKKGNNFLNVFWRAWHNQYLMSLRERNNLLFKQGKVMSIVPNVGDVVLLKQTNQTRSSWPYGVIVSINHSRDNKVRIVEVRLSNGQTVVRPVSLLFPFEFGSNC